MCLCVWQLAGVGGVRGTENVFQAAMKLLTETEILRILSFLYLEALVSWFIYFNIINCHRITVWDHLWIGGLWAEVDCCLCGPLCTWSWRWHLQSSWTPVTWSRCLDWREQPSPCDLFRWPTWPPPQPDNFRKVGFLTWWLRIPKQSEREDLDLDSQWKGHQRTGGHLYSFFIF